MSNYPSSLDPIINQMLSVSRRSSIYLTAPVDNIPQIKLSFATPTLATFSSGANNRTDRDRLHPTWVGKPRRQRTRKNLRKAKKLVKEKPKWTWAKDCHSDLRRRKAKNAALSSRPKDEGEEKDEQTTMLGPDDEKGTAYAASKVETEQNQDTDFFRASTYVFVTDEYVAGEFIATADDSGSFDTDDVHTGATILTVITDTCKGARKPSSEERGQLHALFELMPCLMTREAREQQGENLMSAFEFLIRLYDSPDSTDWGAIESFDHLQVQLKMMEKFDSRAEAEPKEEEGVFVV